MPVAADYALGGALASLEGRVSDLRVQNLGPSHGRSYWIVPPSGHAPVGFPLLAELLAVSLSLLHVDSADSHVACAEESEGSVVGVAGEPTWEQECDRADKEPLAAGDSGPCIVGRTCASSQLAIPSILCGWM